MRSRVESLLFTALTGLADSHGWPELASAELQLERARDPKHGDFTTNVALRLAKPIGLPPRSLAAKIVAHCPTSSFVERIEVAGPGFINLSLSLPAYHDELLAIIERGARYGETSSGTGKRALVEYVSANPTGPLHVGHGRHAAFGASLASLLRATGHDVDEEYYVNDAGRQMDILALSVWLRYLQLSRQPIEFPENCYQGDYCREIAAGLRASHGDRYASKTEGLSEILGDRETHREQRLDMLIRSAKRNLGARGFEIFFAAALDNILADIRDDLAEFGIVPQRWYSEKSLVAGGAIDTALSELDERGLLYEQEGATWFRTTDFGDDKDRVVVRENGARTYFASDIAYHYEKFERGYDLLVDVLGSDHHGYVARLRAGLAGLGKPADCLDVRLVQFVILYRGERKVQMTTRGGTYVTLRELRNEVGNDAARFFYVSRSNDQHLDFDLELAKSQSNDNPVYYVQYAHARIVSMLQKLRDDGFSTPEPTRGAVAALMEPEEKGLMALLSRYPEVVELAAENRAPQILVQFLRELAAQFHSYYNAHRIIVDDEQLRNARCLLTMGTQQVLRNALALLGVSAPTKM
jgi:arginyl-tRNA synthetase